LSAFDCFALGDIADEDAMEDCHGMAPEKGIFVVADGLGGREGGAQASQTAVASFVERVSQLDAAERLEPVALRQALAGVNRDILARGEEDPSVAGLGTTLSAVVLDASRGRIVHVGDSRIYLFRQGKLRQLTRDHTVTAELVAMERLSLENAKQHPLRGVLSRFLGSPNDWEPDFEELNLAPGDWLGLMTDGVSAVLSDPLLESLFAEESSKGAESICRRLIGEALERRPPDNVTTVAVGMR
jgi:protein phosphatase